ncbi:hypothetical protein BRD02_08645 [Halobacteriales archaeon QS_8_69_73]|nr:MAG: hypothetical protein BRD02_08645 [Halobacteriales archaeon QS_8_69_73]
MGAAIDAIGDAGAALRRNPNVLLGAAGSGLVLFVGLVVALVPILGGFVYGIVIVPVALVGLVTMCDAAVEGSTSLGDFTDGIERHGASAVVAYGVWTLLQFAVVIALVVVAVLAGVGLFAASGVASGEPTAGALAGMSAAVALLFLVFFLVAFILGVIQQFLDVAVVLGADGGLDAVKEAVAVVRDGPLSTPVSATPLPGLSRPAACSPRRSACSPSCSSRWLSRSRSPTTSPTTAVVAPRRRGRATPHRRLRPVAGPTTHGGRRTDPAARPRARRPGQQNSCVT